MKKLMFIPILSFMFSCNSSLNDDSTAIEHVVKTDSVVQIETVEKIKKDSALTFQKKIVKDNNEISKKIIGTWALSGSENATFEITKSTFYYPEHSSSYKYKIVGDSIKVKYNDYERSFAFKFEGNDILMLKGDDGEYVYKRKM